MKNAVSAATCDLCGCRFENAYQLGPHKKVCWPSWQKKIFDSPEFSCSSEEEAFASAQAETICSTPPPATTSVCAPQVAPVSLWRLARRDKYFGNVYRAVVEGHGVFNEDLTFDYVAVSLESFPCNFCTFLSYLICILKPTCSF